MALSSLTQAQSAIGEPLLSASIAQINEIETADADNSIRLLKEAGEWQIAVENKLPVQASRMTYVLNTIATFKTGLPMTNSEYSR